jgi:hypothetical protein
MFHDRLDFYGPSHEGNVRETLEKNVIIMRDEVRIVIRKQKESKEQSFPEAKSAAENKHQKSQKRRKQTKENEENELKKTKKTN